MIQQSLQPLHLVRTTEQSRMLSPSNIFRTAVRHAPRLRPSVPPSLGVGSSRLFSSTSATRNAQDRNDDHASILQHLDRAQEDKVARAQTST